MLDSDSSRPDVAAEGQARQAGFDRQGRQRYACSMRAVEFTTELGDQPVIAIPEDIAVQLPKAGHGRIVILTADDPEDAQWRPGVP
jgi:hypothetical protein